MHYAYCIGCGDQVPNGLRMTHVAGEGLQIISQFTVTEGHQGAPGLAHGGLLTLAFDEALGALNYLLRSPAVTARLDMEFLQPVPVGSVLEIVSTLTGLSRRKIYKAAEGRIAGGNGDVVLRAKALFIEVPVSHFTTYGSPEILAQLANNPDVEYNSAAVQVNP
jgi:acyl-coenzyme A thioesterase PaaI-like protein